MSLLRRSLSFSSCEQLFKLFLSSRSFSLRTYPAICAGHGLLDRRKFELDTMRWKSGKEDLSSIVIPVPLTPANNSDDINVGEELTEKIKKDDLLKIINQFFKQPEINIQAAENGLDSKLYHRASVSFRKFCMESETLPVDLHIVFSDILQGAGHLHDIFPYFLQHAHRIFPHLECMEELKQISDLRQPCNWYPEARSIQRKLIFHAGPTNSGKTYHALEKFGSAKSGVYCAPLKLLVAEVFNKTNERGTPCDLITGEERKFVMPDGNPAPHLACTIEMVSVENRYEVAIIDEVQMMRDPNRGWAWTRALLGIAADEVHICGEEAAIDLVKEIAATCGEEVEVRRYKRLTSLTIEDEPLGSITNVQPGDCIVCFSKNDIFNVSLDLEKHGFECAVIYGGLPPGTKLAQAKKFNDPDDPCKILVATDAIGMGLNLSIRRVIFYSVVKPTTNEKGEKEIDNISTSQALQIGGRAGRFNTQFSEGFVTTFRGEDLPVLKNIMSQPVEPIERAGLHPTADQVELFAYHLPHATLSNLIDIFVSLCIMDTSAYFMCDTENFKFLADMIQHVPLPLRARYVFCCAPINKRLPFVCTMFLKFSKQYSQNEPLTADRLCRTIGWPFSAPQNIMDLVHQEAVFDVLDLYLWLRWHSMPCLPFTANEQCQIRISVTRHVKSAIHSERAVPDPDFGQYQASSVTLAPTHTDPEATLSYRFPDLFPDVQAVRTIQQELDRIIQKGVFNITHLLKAEESSESSFSEEGSRHVTNDEGYVKRHGKGRLTEQLLSEGLLTPQMLNELHKEWQTSLTSEKNPENGANASKSRQKTIKSSTKRTKKK